MQTRVYVKMDAHDQLLLSEGVCRQLGIIVYHHPDVKVMNASPQHASSGRDRVTKVPSIRVRLLRSVRVPSEQSTLVSVHLLGCKHSNQPMLLERDPSLDGLQIADALLQPTKLRICISLTPLVLLL